MYCQYQDGTKSPSHLRWLGHININKKYALDIKTRFSLLNLKILNTVVLKFAKIKLDIISKSNKNM